MNEIKRMLVLFRNMTAFIYAWLSLLLVIWGNVEHIEVLSVTLLEDLFIFSALTAAGFSVVFTKVLMKKIGFIGRLNCIMVYIILIEIGFFYKIGLFVTRGSLIQWISFFIIAGILYAVCLVIFCIYSRRKEREYTSLLYQYKMKREKCKDE